MSAVKKYIKRQYDELMDKKLKRMKIDEGSHTDPSKGHCIMEAVSVITGQEFTDEPVCVSQTIINEMIGINDAIPSGRTRAKLKKVVPDIIGTAPAIVKEIRYNGGTIAFETKDVNNPEYIKAEDTRAIMINEFIDWNTTKAQRKNYSMPGSLAELEIPLRDKLAFIKELANVDHFNK